MKSNSIGIIGILITVTVALLLAVVIGVRIKDRRGDGLKKDGSGESGIIDDKKTDDEITNNKPSDDGAIPDQGSGDTGTTDDTSAGDKNGGADTGQFSLGAGDYKYTLKHNGILREYLLYVPSSYGKNKTALIINFHGGGGNAPGHQNISNMNANSEKNGYIVAYPQGTREDGKIFRLVLFWNIGMTHYGEQYRAGTNIENVDDVGFVDAMIGDIESKFNIDKKRIYATGLSNGAMFSQKVACDLSNKIAAIAPVSGQFQMEPSLCNPTREIPVIHFHGTADNFAPYDGGAPNCEVVANDEFVSAKESVDIWKQKNSCSGASSITYQKGDVKCETWNQCGGGSEVTLCTIEGGGHTWPSGNPYPFIGCKPGAITKDIDANEEMWKFFQRHPLP